MRKPGKITKSEIGLLAATAVFLALALAIHFSGNTERSQGSYSVRTWQAAEEPSQSPALIDINTADEETLQQLPGVGAVLAERIAADRAANGPFASLDDLTRVDGIGEKTVEALRPYATAGSAEQEAAHEDSGS